MNETYLMGSLQSVINPPAIVVEAFDEQRLKREWDDACTDENDALARQAAVLNKALQQWPKVPRKQGGFQHHPELRRFVRDVLGMPDEKNGSINTRACRLMSIGPEGLRKRVREAQAKFTNRRRLIERAYFEVTTKYQLGADPKQCMDALVSLLKDVKK